MKSHLVQMPKAFGFIFTTKIVGLNARFVGFTSVFFSVYVLQANRSDNFNFRNENCFWFLCWNNRQFRETLTSMTSFEPREGFIIR